MGKSRAKSSHGTGVAALKSGVGTRVAVPMLGWEAGATGAEIIGYLEASGVGIRDGMGMGWDGQHKYHCGIAVPSHPIPSPSHMPFPFNPMTTLGNYTA